MKLSREQWLQWGHVWVAALILSVGTSQAQYPFEIHVYEYEILARGRFTLEAHLNYVGIGSKESEAPLGTTKWSVPHDL